MNREKRFTMVFSRFRAGGVPGPVRKTADGSAAEEEKGYRQWAAAVVGGGGVGREGMGSWGRLGFQDIYLIPLLPILAKSSYGEPKDIQDIFYLFSLFPLFNGPNFEIY